MRDKELKRLELKVSGLINMINGRFSKEDPSEGMFALIGSDIVLIKKYFMSAASGENVINITYEKENKSINDKGTISPYDDSFYVGEKITGSILLDFLKMYHEVKMVGKDLVVGHTIILNDFLIGSPIEDQSEENLKKIIFIATLISKSNPVKCPKVTFEEVVVEELPKSATDDLSFEKSIPDMVFEKRSETVLPLSWFNFLLASALGCAITLFVLIHVNFGSKSEVDQKQNEWIDNLMDALLLHDSTINQLDSLLKQNREAVIFGDSVRKSMERELLMIDTPKYTIEDSIRGIKVSEYQTDYYDTIPTYTRSRKTIKVSTTHVLPKRREEWK